MKKILIIEDDSMLNKTLAYNLAIDGYEVHSAFSAAEGLKQTKEQNYDLVVLGVNLPDENHFEVYQKLKTHANMSIVFLTTNDAENDRMREFKLGVNDYITKPFPIRIFQKKIAALFHQMDRPETEHFDVGNL